MLLDAQKKSSATNMINNISLCNINLYLMPGYEGLDCWKALFEYIGESADFFGVYLA